MQNELDFVNGLEFAQEITPENLTDYKRLLTACYADDLPTIDSLKFLNLNVRVKHDFIAEEYKTFLEFGIDADPEHGFSIKVLKELIANPAIILTSEIFSSTLKRWMENLVESYYSEVLEALLAQPRLQIDQLLASKKNLLEDFFENVSKEVKYIIELDEEGNVDAEETDEEEDQHNELSLIKKKDDVISILQKILTHPKFSPKLLTDVAVQTALSIHYFPDCTLQLLRYFPLQIYQKLSILKDADPTREKFASFIYALMNDVDVNLKKIKQIFTNYRLICPSLISLQDHFNDLHLSLSKESNESAAYLVNCTDKVLGVFYNLKTLLAADIFITGILYEAGYLKLIDKQASQQKTATMRYWNIFLRITAREVQMMLANRTFDRKEDFINNEHLAPERFKAILDSFPQ